MGVLSAIRRFSRLPQLVRRNGEKPERQLRIAQRQADAAQRQLEALAALTGAIERQSRQLDNLSRVIGRSQRAELFDFLSKAQLSPIDTLEKVRAERLSLARYGDGEFRAAFKYGRAAPFQDGSAKLQDDLRRILKMEGFDRQRLLVGLPEPLSGSPFWEMHWPEFWLSLKPLVGRLSDPLFGSSYVSRPEFFQHYGEEGIAGWRAIWDALDVWVVTGEGSRFEAVDELFSGVRSISTILSLPTEAYADLPRVIARIDAEVPKNGGIILISLGIAGTVLAADLSNLGYWALDVGHISASLDNALGRGPSPESTPIVRPKEKDGPGI